MRKICIVALGLAVLIPFQPALAEIDCAADCPSGEKKVAFLDGNHTTCICIEPGSDMTPTNEEAPVQEPQPGDA